jgi:hypothetical protein
MTLFEAVRDLDSLDEASTIYAAKPWTSASQVTVVLEPNGGSVEAEVAALGLTYFLEVFVAKEFLEGWVANLDTEPTPQQKCERLIAYAVNDA